MSTAKQLPGVIITTGVGVNTLGVIRCFGRRGIPVTNIDSGRGSIAGFRRYIGNSLKLPHALQSEDAFIELLKQYEEKADYRILISHTGDEDVLTLARYKSVLENAFIILCLITTSWKHW